MTTLDAQGWYRDPYGIHQDRYFSAGVATKLVRDCGIEAYDPPPERPLPAGDLILADESGGEESESGSDLRRAGDSAEGYDPAKARRAAFDVFDQSVFP